MEGIKQGDWVLYRVKSDYYKSDDEWVAGIFVEEGDKNYYLINNRLGDKSRWEVIPYIGNEHLLGTRDSIWEPEIGQFVAAYNGYDSWVPVIYDGKTSDGKHHKCRFHGGQELYTFDIIEPFSKHFKAS